MRNVVITAMGVVSPIGKDIAEFKQSMFAGLSGIKPIKGKRVPNEFPVPYAGIIEGDLKVPAIFGDQSAEQLPPFALFTGLATEQALQSLPNDLEFDGIIYGTAEGISFDLIQESLKKDDPTDVDFKCARAESALDVINSQLEQAGFKKVKDLNCITVNSACASGNQAIGLAMHRIRSGQWNRAIVGGVDARCNKSNFMNFNMLGALTTADVEPATASRPFAGDRTGFVRGEGAATLVLESEESAKARGAEILARVSGYGNTTDAYRLTDGREDGSSVIQAMRWAIKDGGLDPQEIDVVSAHGTSTKLNDRLETFACKQVFGESAKDKPVTSLKSQTGHSTVAAGAMEAISCVLMLQDQKIAPTINYHVPDPECDLDYVPNEARPAGITHILSNNFGFGGQNACLVFTGGLT